MTATAADIGQKELPAGWKWVKLGDVAEAIRGVTFKSGESLYEPKEGYVPCVTTSAVQLQPDWTTARYIPAKSVKRNNQMIRTGDVLVSTANSKALVGKSCLVGVAPFECTFGAFVTVVRPHTDIDYDWLASYMHADSAKRFFYEKSANTTNISNLKVSDLLELSIPLPPLEEQKRIAGILNEQMDAVDEAKKAAQERLEAAQALPAAYLREKLLSNESQLPDGWLSHKIGDFLQLKHGYAFKSSCFSDEGEYIVLTPGHFYEQGGFRFNADKQKRYVGDIPAGFILKRDDIVIVMTQQARGLIGSCALIPESDLYLHNQRLGKVVDLDESLVMPKLLYHLFNTRYVREQLETTATGSMVQHTSPSRVYEVAVELPPLSQQSKLIVELDEAIAGVKLAEASIQQELDTIEAVPAALLRKAFSGGL